VLVCGRTPSDPHHIKFADSWTVGRSVSDRFHHRAALPYPSSRASIGGGNELVWWQQQEIDPLPRANGLWKLTHTLEADGSFLDDKPCAAGGEQKAFCGRT